MGLHYSSVCKLIKKSNNQKLVDFLAEELYPKSDFAMQENQMTYELRYYLMCGVDGDVDEKQTTRELSASDDVQAIGTANDILKREKSGLVIPWAPMLYQGERRVAISDPSYPPRAHHLAWVCSTKELVA